MTAIRRDGLDTPFGAWIRNHPCLDSISERLSVIDRDYWIHQYRDRRDKIGIRRVDNIGLLELKTFCADTDYPQRDTLVLVHQLLIRNTRHGYVTLKGIRHGERRLVRSWGCALLQLSSDRPDNSERIWWNRNLIDESMLVDLLRFDRDWLTLRKRSDRRHHLPSLTQSHPVLFAVGST